MSAQHDIQILWEKILGYTDVVNEIKELAPINSPCMIMLEVLCADDKGRCKVLYTKKGSPVWDTIVQSDAYVRDLVGMYDSNCHILVGLAIEDQDTDDMIGSFRIFDSITFEKIKDSTDFILN